MKKAISLIASFLCALSCLTMAGCGKKKTTEVYFLNFKPESATVYEELAKNGVAVEVGIVERNGALGKMQSLYVRDPDGNLVEISKY